MWNYKISRAPHKISWALLFSVGPSNRYWYLVVNEYVVIIIIIIIIIIIKNNTNNIIYNYNL